MKIIYILFVLLNLKSTFCLNKKENEKEQIIKIEKVIEKLTHKAINDELILNDIKLIIENLQIFSFYSNITKLGNHNQCLNNITFIILFDIDMYKNYSYFDKTRISKKKHCYSYLNYKLICFRFRPDNTMGYYLNERNLLNFTYNFYFDKFKVFENIFLENEIKIKKFFNNTLIKSFDRIFEFYPISIYETYYLDLIKYISSRSFEINIPQFNITHITIRAIFYDNVEKNKKSYEYILKNVKIHFQYKNKITSNWKIMEITYLKFIQYQIVFGQINKEEEFRIIIMDIFLKSKLIILKNINQ